MMSQKLTFAATAPLHWTRGAVLRNPNGSKPGTSEQF